MANKEELKAALDEKGVSYPDTATNKELQALLDDSSKDASQDNYVQTDPDTGEPYSERLDDDPPADASGEEGEKVSEGGTEVEGAEDLLTPTGPGTAHEEGELEPSPESDQPAQDEQANADWVDDGGRPGTEPLDDADQPAQYDSDEEVVESDTDHVGEEGEPVSEGGDQVESAEDLLTPTGHGSFHEAVNDDEVHEYEYPEGSLEPSYPADAAEDDSVEEVQPDGQAEAEAEAEFERIGGDNRTQLEREADAAESGRPLWDRPHNQTAQLYTDGVGGTHTDLERAYDQGCLGKPSYSERTKSDK